MRYCLLFLSLSLFALITSSMFAQVPGHEPIDSIADSSIFFIDNLTIEEQDTINKLPVNDSGNATVAEDSSLLKTSSTFTPEPFDTARFPQKKFRGTGRDIIIGAVVTGAWLFFMWVAANQGPN